MLLLFLSVSHSSLGYSDAAMAVSVHHYAVFGYIVPCLPSIQLCVCVCFMLYSHASGVNVSLQAIYTDRISTIKGSSGGFG